MLTILEHTLHSEKVEVWITISRKRIVGPIIFEYTILSEIYYSDIVYMFNENETNAYLQQEWTSTRRLCRSDDYLEDCLS